jgi:hypothetical protein
VENTHAVKQTRMSSARIYEIRKPELLNPSEALKRACLYDPPEHVLQLRLLDVKLDKVVQWIANPLLLGHS